jgi:hypothetical protein
VQESSLRKAAGIAGIVFVVLLVVSVVLTIGAPTPDKSTAKIVKWAADNRQAIFTSAALEGLMLIAFLWFLGYLYHELSRLGGARAALASVLMVTGVATVTIATITGLPLVALAVTASRPGVSPTDGVVHLLADLENMGGVASFGVALFLLVLGLLLADRALSPRWAMWVAYVGAALSVIGAVANFYVSKAGKPDAGGLLGLIGLVLFAITVLVLSTDLFRGRAVTA